MYTSPFKRILSIILTVAMIFTMSGMTAFAEEGTLPLGTSTILDCHLVHDDDCGYIEAVAAADCTHEHDELCGFVVGAEEIPCDMDCTDTDDDGVVEHAESCAYTIATGGTPCTHEHDDECGFAEAVTGAECTHTCELCEDKDSDKVQTLPQGAQLIRAFAPLDEAVRYQRATSPVLPETLTATADGVITEIPVTWSAEGYNADTPDVGLYTFYAELGEGYTLAEGVDLPKITVMLV